MTIDDLLSAEKLISIAEKENKSNIQKVCDLLFGMVDLFYFLLIILPIYPKTIEGHIYSVNLFQYAETTLINRSAYWIMFLSLILLGAMKVLLIYLKIQKIQKAITVCSMVISIITVCFLALTRGTYVVTLAFLLLVIKATLERGIFKLQV